jgi:hypothetical protein
MILAPAFEEPPTDLSSEAARLFPELTNRARQLIALAQDSFDCSKIRKVNAHTSMYSAPAVVIEEILEAARSL